LGRRKKRVPGKKVNTRGKILGIIRACPFLCLEKLLILHVLLVIIKWLVHWVDSHHYYIKNQTLSQGSMFKVQRTPFARDNEKGGTTDYTDYADFFIFFFIICVICGQFS
jgi:hypothetical protein